MTTVNPGDEVTVTITGTVEAINHAANAGIGIRTVDLFGYWIDPRDQNAKVTVLRPDRPTRREVLEAHTIALGWCKCGEVAMTGADRAEHIDAELTKWEEN